MLDTDLRPRSTAVPLGHKLIAVIIAVAAGWGVYSWFSHRAMWSAQTAGLSFDAAAARSIDPGLADAREPAAALAQSILNDAAIEGLSKQAYLASSAMSSRIGEFRSRLELTQPSAHVLDVRFHDTNPARSQETANAVAQTLAAWTPSSAAAAAPAVTPQPAPPADAAAAPSVSSPAAAAKAPSARPAAQPDHPLSDALGALEAELAATNRQLDRVGETSARTRSGRRPHAGQPSSYNQAKQQQLLRNEVKTAQKKLDHLQVQYANDDPAAGVAERLTEIRHALASVWPASNAGGRGFNGAGVSASQLRRERAELSHVIAVVDRERHAIQRAESARGVTESDVASSSSSPTAHASASGPAASPSTPSPSTSATGSAAPAPTPASTAAPKTGPAQPQPAPSLAAGASSKNPLQLIRLASSAPPVSPWPPVGAGVLCCLLYLGVAKWRYRHVPADDYIVESTLHRSPQPQRFITPNEPVPVADSSLNKVADWSGIRADAAPAATAQRQRAFFTFDPAPPENAPARVVPPEEDEPPSPSPVHEPHSFAPADEPPSPGPEDEPPSTGSVQEPHSLGPEDEPPSPSPVHEPHSFAPADEPPSPAPAEEPRSLGPVEQPRSIAPAKEPSVVRPLSIIPGDSAVETGDPVADRIRKAFSEGSIRTLFEEPAVRNREDAVDPDEEGSERSAPPDRLAG